MAVHSRRGQGSVYRQKGTNLWSIAYCVDGKRVRESTGDATNPQCNVDVFLVGGEKFVMRMWVVGFIDPACITNNDWAAFLQDSLRGFGQRLVVRGGGGGSVSYGRDCDFRIGLWDHVRLGVWSGRRSGFRSHSRLRAEATRAT
jgi:hypothetical protein